MSVAAQPSAKGSAPQLDDMPVPVTPVAPAPSLPGSPVSPAHRIYFYSPGEWEVFITEWATGLAVSYRQIKRLGGPNDRGVDVAAFKTERGLEDSWDCFQAKHYADSLTLSDAIPEILKLFRGVIDAYYVLPGPVRLCRSSRLWQFSQPSSEQADRAAEEVPRSGRFPWCSNQGVRGGDLAVNP